jgi:hypothetical protein
LIEREFGREPLRYEQWQRVRPISSLNIANYKQFAVYHLNIVDIHTIIKHYFPDTAHDIIMQHCGLGNVRMTGNFACDWFPGMLIGLNYRGDDSI